MNASVFAFSQTSPKSPGAVNIFNRANLYSIEGYKYKVNYTSSDWKQKLDAELQELIRLPRGWDGYAGLPVNFANACFAVSVIDSIYSAQIPKPSVVAGTSGDLQIEWHNDNFDVELHILNPNKVIAWARTPQTGNDGIEIELTTDFIEVADWLNSIYG